MQHWMTVKRQKLKEANTEKKNRWEWNETATLASIFFEVLLYFEETNLWGRCPIQPTKPGPFSKRQNQRRATSSVEIPEDEGTNDNLHVIDDEHTFLSLSGKLLNKDVLFSTVLVKKEQRNILITFWKREIGLTHLVQKVKFHSPNSTLKLQIWKRIQWTKN